MPSVPIFSVQTFRGGRIGRALVSCRGLVGGAAALGHEEEVVRIPRSVRGRSICAGRLQPVLNLSYMRERGPSASSGGFPGCRPR